MGCGAIYLLCLVRCLASFLLFFLNSLTATPSGSAARSAAQRGYIFRPLPPTPPSSSSSVLPHLHPFKPPTGRQLWIIKWWIRAYFLPTQTGDGWARRLAIGLIPLSTRNSTKSHRCLPSFSGKTVDSPAHPRVRSTPGSTRLGSSRLKFLQ